MYESKTYRTTPNDRYRTLVEVRSFFIAHLVCFAMTFVVNSQIVLRQADVIILVLKNLY
jgi:hypothetical protein